MIHLINGTKIKAAVQRKLEVVKAQFQEELISKRIVVFQFDLPEKPSTKDLAAYQAANTSTNQKQKIFSDFLGCEFERVDLPCKMTYDEFAKLIADINDNDNVCGIIIQNPIPNKLRENNNKIVELIDPSKDIDAMSQAGKSQWGCCATADAICRVLEAGLKQKSTIAVVGYLGFVGEGVINYLVGLKRSILKNSLKPLQVEGFTSKPQKHTKLI
jgi:methylenetetrahydrofolate dehydrogenase (NADP+) / methenyltetrahydrofolate cyclohydrolase